MSDPLARGPAFPTICPRCSGRLFEPVSYCPNCGAQMRQAPGERAPAKVSQTASASTSTCPALAHADVSSGGSLRFARPTLLFDSPDYGLDGKARPAHGTSRPRTLKIGTALTVLAFLVLFGASVLRQRQEDSAPRESQETSQTTRGSVVADDPTQYGTATAAGRGTAIAQGARAGQGAKPSADPASSHASATTVASPQNLAPGDEPPRDRRSRLMSLALARAHGGLDKNDLRLARSGVFWALSLEPDNTEAISLKQELLSRERNRE